ncbi:MAG: family 43 glycosylhydrolase [Cyclobacteriaceae bacterium]
MITNLKVKAISSLTRTGLAMLFILLLFACDTKVDQVEEVSDDSNTLNTFCNPIDLSYRFRPETNENSRREAADPTVVFFKDRYYLFASKSGGYWHSFDLTDWKFIQTDKIPTERYAPTVIVLRDSLFLAGSSKTDRDVYKSGDPLSGEWIVEDYLDFPVEDPAFFQDTDGKLYLYWGCSNEKPLYGSEIDPISFSLIGETTEILNSKRDIYGWEVRGDYNLDYDRAPWIEGAWVNKYQGKYYFQYSAPGTREKSYADGVYVSDTPLGEYQLQQHNPFSYKPEGYSTGAGHGSTITDEYGNYWHYGTGIVSVKHIFERRINFFPAFFDEDGLLYSITKYGDYPLIMPETKIESFDDIFPSWMLLSYDKQVEVSSSLDSFPANNMTNESIRTYWAAGSGSEKEWAIMDLGESYDVHAIQLNFAEHNTEIYGRQEGLKHRYRILGSNNMKDWEMVIDQSENSGDESHRYHQLPASQKYRYLKMENIEVPGGNLAISGFRVFGKGSGDKPAKLKKFNVRRDAQDRRRVHLNWSADSDAVGYNISFGIAEDKLYHNYIVYGDSSLTINSLNAKENYFYTIEAFNENGITPTEELVAD